MSYRLAINGFGRIGRCVLRALYESGLRNELQIVAINEPADLKTIAHLTRYDTTHGRFPGTVELQEGPAGNVLVVNGDRIRLYGERHWDQLDWQREQIDLVLECSGRFGDRETAEALLARGGRRLLYSHPADADADVDNTIIYGINQHELLGRDRIVSTGSCTTNCIVPVIKVLDECFGIDVGTITTIHSAMNDQPVLDAYHHTDLRKTRAAGQSIIPVDTELARGISRILPAMEGVFTAHALRVPTVNVSAMDLVVGVRKATDVTTVNRVLREASIGPLAAIMGYTEEPLASCDFNHDARSVIVDASQTRVSRGSLVKVLCWIDNEWAYASRMLDVARCLKALDV